MCLRVCGGAEGVEELQSKVELLLCTCCEPFWIRGPVKHLKCKRTGSCWGAQEGDAQEEVRGAEGEEIRESKPGA